VVILKKVDDYLNRQAPRIYGIKPKNSEQNLALNLLMDREIDLPDLSAPFFKKNISA
jgi:predicted ribonuclease YlaK